MIRRSIIAIGISVAAAPAVAEGDFDFEKGFAAFEGLFGVTEGKRRNHTKGFALRARLHP